jgi:uncharacterized membrane protein
VKLIDILQGKWLGHPLHPAIVHVPIGGWLAACVFDVIIAAGWTQGGPSRLAFYCVVVGLIGAVLAVPPGIADWLSIKKGKPAHKLGVYHMLLNFAAAIVWGVNLALRLSTSQPVNAMILATSILGTVLVLVSGYLGSLMVFDHGVSVARQSKKVWRERAARGGARLPDET